MLKGLEVSKVTFINKKRWPPEELNFVYEEYMEAKWCFKKITLPGKCSLINLDSTSHWLKY